MVRIEDHHQEELLLTPKSIKLSILGRPSADRRKPTTWEGNAIHLVYKLKYQLHLTPLGKCSE